MNKSIASRERTSKKTPGRKINFLPDRLDAAFLPGSLGACEIIAQALAGGLCKNCAPRGPSPRFSGVLTLGMEIALNRGRHGVLPRLGCGARSPNYILLVGGTIR